MKSLAARPSEAKQPWAGEVGLALQEHRSMGQQVSTCTHVAPAFLHKSSCQERQVGLLDAAQKVC